MRAKRGLDSEAIKTILALYKYMTNKEVAIRANVSEKVVSQIANEYGLRKHAYRERRTDKEQQERMFN